MKHLNLFTVRYLCNDPWLDNKMLQLTMCQQHQLADKQYPVITVNDYNDINVFKDSAEFLFIQTAGDYVVDRDYVWELLHNIPDNVGLIGHIIWDPKDSTPHLHRQCFIINTKALEGLQFDLHSRQFAGRKFIRSEQSMHGDYCPAWVKLSDEYGPRTPGFGTDLMSLILDNGYDVVNFNEDWRSIKSIDYLSHMPARGFFNQDIGTELFSHCLKTLTLDEKLDPAQYEAIKVIKHELEFNILNVLHWDHYPKKKKANVVVSPANGFMGECIAQASGATKIVFYDINKNNIDFKKKLYAEWNGKDYETFYTAFAKERNLILDPYTVTAQDAAKYHAADVKVVIDNWEKFKALDVEFIHGDIIDITDSILEKVVERTILHTSTILKYFTWSNFVHDLDVMDAVRTKIEKRIKETKSIWYET